MEEYRKIAGNRENILDLLAMPDADLVEFDPPRLGNELCEPADLS